jgi:protein disulfide-isomerase
VLDKRFRAVHTQMMRLAIFIALAWFTGGLAVRADEQFRVLKAGSETYSNVTVTSVSATDIYFTHAGGMANVKLKNLSPDLQKHFHFDPKQAQTVELQQAENKVKYHEELLNLPTPPPAAGIAKVPPVAVRAADLVWRTDLPGALKQARSDEKLVLLDFTGSDWCPWCIKFDQEVLSTDRFAGYALNRLELVKLDFPRHTPLGDDLKQANEALVKKFKVDGIPTYVLLDANGRELGRQVGYVAGGPDKFIVELDGFSRR